MQTLDYARHFAPGGVCSLARHGMYELRVTYDLLRDVFGYASHYVNFGYWPDGMDTEEPGRRLTLLLGERVGLKPGDRLLDAGCGLGQGAIDLTSAYGLSSVVGVNPCGPQVGFARQLAALRGLSHRIEVVQDCANAFVERLDSGSVDHAIAVECLSYFPDALHFLGTLRARVLPREGRVAFCVVTSDRPQSRWERLFVGLVANSPSRPGSWFEDVARRAGFRSVEREDVTATTLAPAIAQARRRVDEDPERLRRHGWMADQVVRRLIDQAESDLASGWMRYELITARTT